MLGDEALRLAGELGEDEGFTSHGLSRRRKGMSREREYEQTRPRLCHTGRLAERPPKLRGGTSEVPDTVRDHEIDTAISRGNALHRGQDQLKAVVESICLRTTGGGAQHGPGEIGADDRPAETRERDGVPPRAAAEVEGARAPGAPQFLLREGHQYGVRRRLRESRHGAGSAPRRSGKGSMLDVSLL